MTELEELAKDILSKNPADQIRLAADLLEYPESQDGIPAGVRIKLIRSILDRISGELAVILLLNKKP